MNLEITINNIDDMLNNGNLDYNLRTIFNEICNKMDEFKGDPTGYEHNITDVVKGIVIATWSIKEDD